jgi:hypothetical protein
MTEVSIDLQALINRIDKVESQYRHLKLWGILIPIVLLTGGFSVEIPKPPKVISAEKICLVDKNGFSRLKLELENGVPQITLTYEDGNPSLRMSGEEISFYNRANKAHINILVKNILGGSTLAIKDNNDKNCITLSTGPDGPYISIIDNEEGKEVILSIDPVGTLNAVEISSGKRKLSDN